MYELIMFFNIHRAHVVSPSTALEFLRNMNKRGRSASPSAIQVKNRQKTTSIEEKFDVISRPGKGEQTVDICHNVGLAHSSVRTVGYNAYRLTVSTK